MSSTYSSNPNTIQSPGSEMGESKMAALLRQEGLSGDSLDWLKTSLDPFSDVAHKIEGRPIGSGLKTKVVVVQKAYNITRPPTFDPELNWQCHIVQTPLARGEDFVATTAQGNFVTTQAPGTTFSPGPLTIQCYQNESQLSWNVNDDAGQVTSNLTLGDNYLVGAYRLVGGGFEVRNTSPELYISGNSTNYVAPACRTADMMYLGASTGTANMFPCRTLRLPPQTPDEAIALPSTKQLSAKEGVYSVVRFEDIETGFKVPDFLPILFRKKNNTTNSKAFYSAGYSVATTGQTGRSLFDCMYNGSFFNGLHPNSVLSLIVRWVLEIAPDADDVPFVALATDLPYYDPKAIEMYIRISARLPAGVPVSWNDFGTWWASVKKVIGAIAKPLAKVAEYSGIPIVSQVGKGVSTYLSEKKAKKQAKANMSARGNAKASKS